VVIKNPSDFIGDAVGASEQNTRKILAATVGKVLIIDEAYMLYSGRHDGHNNSYKSAVIDTLVAEVQVPGADRCILLLGYEDRLKDMFQHVNPGLARRFRIDQAFRFEDFNVPQLKKILQLKMREQDLSATSEAIGVARDILDRARSRANYSNAGEVITLLDTAKINYQARQEKLPPAERAAEVVFQPQDFDPNHDRHVNASQNLKDQLQGLVSDDIIKKLQSFVEMARYAKTSGVHPSQLIPTAFIFKGPPG